MLIDTKLIKRLNFPFCKSNAIYLLADYMDRNVETIKSIQQRIPFLIDFMEWMFVHGHLLLDQESLNEYIALIYSKNSFGYAEAICSYIRSFCKYLQNEGFCGFVSFSSKPKSEEKDSTDFQNDKDVVDEESPKRKRGRPRKGESTSASNDFSAEAKRRRGRPRKSSTVEESVSPGSETEESVSSPESETEEPVSSPESETEESVSSSESETEESESEKNTKENSGFASDRTEEKAKRRRGRPRKNDIGLKRVSNYYQFLGVSPDADLSDIKKAFRKKAMELHPDLHADDPMSETRFKSLNRIMSVLKDSVQRMVYDVAFGFREYDRSMEYVSYEKIEWLPKRYYYVFI